MRSLSSYTGVLATVFIAQPIYTEASIDLASTSLGVQISFISALSALHINTSRRLSHHSSPCLLSLYDPGCPEGPALHPVSASHLLRRSRHVSVSERKSPLHLSPPTAFVCLSFVEPSRHFHFQPTRSYHVQARNIQSTEHTCHGTPSARQ